MSVMRSDVVKGTGSVFVKEVAELRAHTGAPQGGCSAACTEAQAASEGMPVSSKGK